MTGRPIRRLALVTDPPCTACQGTGRLVDVSLYRGYPPQLVGKLAPEPRCPSCGGPATYLKGPNPLGGPPIDIFGCSKCCPRNGDWFLLPHGVGCPCEECRNF